MRGPQMLLAVAGLLSGYVLGGCAKGPVLEPAPDARQVPGGAMDEVADITVMVRPGQWRGLPIVGDVVEPVEVALVNDSAVPLRVRYEQFSLTSRTGRRFIPVPPNEVEMNDLTALTQLRENGLAEGVIRPGESRQGFLYFQELPETVDYVTFQANLVNDRTGRQMGQAEIPFLVRHDGDLVGARQPARTWTVAR